MELKIFHLRSAVAEIVFPPVESLRVIRRPKGRGPMRLYYRFSVKLFVAGERGDGGSVDREGQVVIHRLLSRKRKNEFNGLRLIGWVCEFVGSRELNAVRAVPEKAFFSVAEQQIDIDSAFLERQRHPLVFVLRDVKRFSIRIEGRYRFCDHNIVAGARRRLVLRSFPGRGDLAFEVIIGVIGAAEKPVAPRMAQAIELQKKIKIIAAMRLNIESSRK